MNTIIRNAFGTGLECSARWKAPIPGAGDSGSEAQVAKPNANKVTYAVDLMNGVEAVTRRQDIFRTHNVPAGFLTDLSTAR